MAKISVNKTAKTVYTDNSKHKHFLTKFKFG